MNPADLLALYDQDQRIDVRFPGIRREVLPNGIVRHVSEGPGGGFINYSRLDEATVDAAIEDQIAYFDSIGQDFEWKVYGHDTPPDLKGRLAARGFTPDEPESLLIYDLATASADLLAPVAHDIRRVTDPDQLGDALSVPAQVWNEDDGPFREQLAYALRSAPDTISIYVAYADGQPVSSARAHFTPGSVFGSLWGGATLPAYRKRGFYTALLAVRVQEAIARGRRFLTIDASPMSRPIVEALGFQFITTMQGFNWEPPSGSRS